VVTVTRGPDVLARALQLPPDVVIMDPMLPGMSGASATKLLKANPNTAGHSGHRDHGESGRRNSGAKRWRPGVLTSS
jgi:CheY-like chemotaxis protein